VPRLGLHSDPAHERHDAGNHPENPARVQAILSHLQQVDLLRRLVPVPEREATEEDLRLAHQPSLIDLVRRTEAMGGAWLDPDTAVLPGSFAAAARAVGGALQAVDMVLDGALDVAFCIDRPPGHHATPNRAMGFCLFNQVAVAARHALTRSGLRRVAIVDYDVHHGNGTQEIFWTDADVLYCSTHEYPFYPGSGHWREIGEGPGRGATLNLSLPAGCGDAEYLAAFDQVIIPALRRFRPDLILVSAGFDAHLADPLADMAVTAAGYEGMARRLAETAAELCAGRVVVVLEGGYRPEAVARAVELSVRAFLGEPPAEVPPAEHVRPDVARLLAAVRHLHGLD
jgi:acetoin utilization deacetylase AcuC-like enzyme